MQLRLRHIAKGVLSNWLAMAASMLVAFFLSPLLVHRLGNIVYGLWVLVISSINYFGLLDLGMRNSVVRYVSKGHATGDHRAASEAFSAAFWVRLQISILALVLCAGLAVMLPRAFKIPPELTNDARMVTALMGLSFAVYMSIGVYGGVVSALSRYDLYTVVILVQLTLRVIGIVAVLRTGHGIVAVGYCELVAAITGNFLMAYIATRLYPELKLSITKPRMDVLKTIWSYSFYAFLVMVAVQLIYQSDNLVVGAFVSASAVTFYSIGNSLCRYTQQLVAAMTATFTPAASTYEAAGDASSLRALYHNGTRATMALSLPILVTLIIRGDTFIGIWMGPQYSRSSGTVVAILATALLFSIPNTPASSIAFGVEKHKAVAKWAIGEGIANLSLSVVLSRVFGIYGVAIGTLVPSLIVNLVLWPRYVSHLVGLTGRHVLLNVWGPVFLSAIPFAAASFAVDIYLPAKSMSAFILQTIALLSIFGASVGWMFRSNIKRVVLPRIGALFHAGAN